MVFQQRLEIIVVRTGGGDEKGLLFDTDLLKSLYFALFQVTLVATWVSSWAVVY